MRLKLLPYGLLGFCVLFANCSDKKDKGNNVQASLALTYATSISVDTTGCPDLGDGEVSECWTPTSYGFKLLKVIVSPDEHIASRK